MRHVLAAVLCKSNNCHPVYDNDGVVKRSEIVRKANDLAQSRAPESARSAMKTSGNSDSPLSLGRGARG